MNSGQVCLCLKYPYVHESIYEQFCDALVEQASGVKVGNSFGEGVTRGPIQNSMQCERVKGFFAEIEKQGQKVAVGDKNEHGSKGYFITLTIIDNPSDDSRIVVEEPFGESVFRSARLTVTS
jgi:acyl-CoA reductase-like NAD-dependent aldehyde dehydrogenase